jgi:lipid A disaccharide synthetase
MNIISLLPKNRLTVVHVVVLPPALLIVLTLMCTVHMQAARVKEVERLNDGLLQRIDELERQNHQLTVNIAFHDKHIRALEEANEAWRTSHGQFQSSETHYRVALDAARHQLAQCVDH